MEYYKFVITTIENQDRQDWFGFYSSILGIAYAGLGRKDEAIAKGRNSVLASSRNALIEPLALGSLARIYVMTEEYESAVNVLEQLLSIPGELSGPLLQIDPRWVELRDHPGFQRLLRQYETETDS